MRGFACDRAISDRHSIDFFDQPGIGKGVIPAEKVSTDRLTAIERCIQAYEQYLREARAWSRASMEIGKEAGKDTRWMACDPVEDGT
jgi:hypothetical protein